MSTTADATPDELVLAAIERANLHLVRDTPGVPIWEIYEHLAFPRRSMRARRIRSQLDALEAGGFLERSCRHGVQIWVLTRSGRRRRRRRRAHLAGSVPQLPESPQHRAWRNARTAAAQEIDRFRQSLRESLGEAISLLDAEPPAGSDKWFEMCERLRRAAWCVGSASYCLHEWIEPSDEQADIDDHQGSSDDQLAPDQQRRHQVRRHGRRNIRLWET